MTVVERKERWGGFQRDPLLKSALFLIFRCLSDSVLPANLQCLLVSAP